MDACGCCSAKRQKTKESRRSRWCCSDFGSGKRTEIRVFSAAFPRSKPTSWESVGKPRRPRLVEAHKEPPRNERCAASAWEEIFRSTPVAGVDTDVSFREIAGVNSGAAATYPDIYGESDLAVGDGFGCC